MRGIVCVLFCCSSLSASYQLSNLLPGEAIDAYTDLTAFSFSVPHPLKRFGFSVSPTYQYASHTEGYSESRHYGAAALFGYVQWERLRIGTVSTNTARSSMGNLESITTNSKLMASYLFSFFSLGVEAGGMRSSVDAPSDNWGAAGAVTASLYFAKWSIDGAVRLQKPNSSFAAGQAVPDPLNYQVYQDPRRDNQLYSLRWRYEFSFRWRTIVAGNYLTSSYASFGSLSNLWRFRSENMQIVSGLAYRRNTRQEMASYSYSGDDSLYLPLYAILEHGRSIFYIGASTPVYRAYRGNANIPVAFLLRFDPQVAYTHRFTGRLWLNVALGSQFVSITDDGYSSGLRRDFRCSFQLSYNIAPFGADDEVAFSENLMFAAR